MDAELLRTIARVAVDPRLQHLILSGRTELATKIVQGGATIMLTEDESREYFTAPYPNLSISESPERPYDIRLE